MAAFPLCAQFPPSRIASGPRNPLAGQADAVSAGCKGVRQLLQRAVMARMVKEGRGPNLTMGRRFGAWTIEGYSPPSVRVSPERTCLTTSLLDDDTWRVLVAFVRSLSAPANESKLPGDPDAGAAIFFGKGGCDGCNMIRGAWGDSSGRTSLTPVRSTRRRSCAKRFLNPSARIADGYQGVTATMQDGVKISGVARNDDDYSIQILDKKGDLHLLSKSNLRDVLFQKNSLMPGDYGRRLTADEISNVLAFLSRQSVRPPGERPVDPRTRGVRR